MKSQALPCGATKKPSNSKGRGDVCLKTCHISSFSHIVESLSNDDGSLDKFRSRLDLFSGLIDPKLLLAKLVMPAFKF